MRALILTALYDCCSGAVDAQTAIETAAFLLNARSLEPAGTKPDEVGYTEQMTGPTTAMMEVTLTGRDDCHCTKQVWAEGIENGEGKTLNSIISFDMSRLINMSVLEIAPERWRFTLKGADRFYCYEAAVSGGEIKSGCNQEYKVAMDTGVFERWLKAYT